MNKLEKALLQLELLQSDYENPGEVTLSYECLQNDLVCEAFDLKIEDVKIALRTLKENLTTQAVFGPNGCFLYDKGEIQ